MPIMAYDRAKRAARLETDRPRQASRQIGRQAGTQGVDADMADR
jgi:hypothetical protein